MEAIDDRISEGLKAKAHALFNPWRETFGAEVLDQGFMPIEVEGEFVFPLVNPDDGKESETFVESGKRDGVLEDKDGNIWLLEHKTSSEDISPGSNYWKRLSIDTQISKYLLSLIHEFPDREVMGVIYDVVKKPTIRFGTRPVLDEDGKKIVLDGSGSRVLNKNGSPKQSVTSGTDQYLEVRDETPDEYEERCRENIENSEKSFVEIQKIAQTNETLQEYMKDAWASAEQILYWREKNLWPKNPESCLHYGSCEFLELCVGQSSVDGVRYRERTSAHPELSSAPGVSEKELLTNSRLRALRKCNRYHYHRYEKPIEPVKEYSEALWFGSYWHDQLEDYLAAYMPNN
tara:strand:- start:7817 stop:8854 length:1038 start_codon:yes stop_codon:yes gene_type:complete